MPDRPLPEAQTLADLPAPLLDEVIRQFRAARNDILRYGVWNVRNLSDEEFNRTDDYRLYGYFRQDLLETRFINKGRRIDLLQVWQWFDDQLSGSQPLLLGGHEVFLNVQDKDIDKLRKRIAELKTFFPILRTDDIEAFRRVKYKLRRTVLRLTYDLHHLAKRLDKYRKGGTGMTRPDVAAALEPPADVPEPPPVDFDDTGAS